MASERDALVHGLYTLISNLEEQVSTYPPYFEVFNMQGKKGKTLLAW